MLSYGLGEQLTAAKLKTFVSATSIGRAAEAINRLSRDCIAEISPSKRSITVRFDGKVSTTYIEYWLRSLKQSVLILLGEEGLDADIVKVSFDDEYMVVLTPLKTVPEDSHDAVWEGICNALI